MAERSVLLVGGAGFIGSHIVAKLSSCGWRVIVPTRRFGHAKHLILLPKVEVLEANLNDDTVCSRIVRGVDCVVNLVGVLHSKRATPYGPGFAKAHVELPRRIAAACAANGVRRYLHMSALGADKNAASMYLRSKADGEAAAMAHHSVLTTIFRPSVVFGAEDNFLNTFAKLQKYFPVIPLAGANAKFQPIHVEDVARAFLGALENPDTIGKTITLVGPKVYTLRELVMLAGTCSGHMRPVIGLPDALARLQAWFFEHLPGEPLITRDNLDSMTTENTAATANGSEVRVMPTTLEAVAPHYLGEANQAAEFDAFRSRARR